MILTLPVSHLISENNYSRIPGIRALEYRNPQPVFNSEMECLFHSNYGIIQKEFIDYFDSISDYLNENKFKLFSFDFGPAVEAVKIQDFYYVTESDLLSKSELEKKVHSRLSYVKSKFNGDIAMENLNYYPTTAYSHICEAEFISDIIRKNDVYMVLDIAHAVISAHNMEIDRYEYLSSLPLDRVKEIHLSAPGIKDGKWQDLHEIPTIDEYKILNFIRERLFIKPYIVVEYYKNISVLREIYSMLNDNVMLI